MNVKLYDSELKVMDVLWKKGEMPAKDIAKELIDWVFGGSKIRLSASFLDNEEITEEEWKEIMEMINRKK